MNSPATQNQLTVLSTEICQQDKLYSLNDLHRASGGEAKHQPNRFMRLDQTKELIAEILKYPEMGILPVKIIRGLHGGTYVCRELVYAYAMWVSAKFHLVVIRAFDMTIQTIPQATLTTSQIGELATLIAERFPDGRDRPYAWGRFNNHFRLASYKDLPPHLFDEACKYIRAMPPKEQHLMAIQRQSPDDRSYQWGKLNIENIQEWAERALTGRNQSDVLTCCREAKKSLVSGWTEMDEAILKIAAAMASLRRWRDGQRQ